MFPRRYIMLTKGIHFASPMKIFRKEYQSILRF
jgi:hypothetical protein